MSYIKEYIQYGVIYALISPKGKYYIGQTAKSYRLRWGCYKRLDCKDQQKIYNALKKYGPENFVYSILEFCDSQQELDDKEKYYILNHNSILEGYNIQTGGNVLKFTPEICAKISKTKKERNKTRIHCWTGRHHSEETKQKLREMKLGKKLKPHTEKWKKQMSERMKGEKNPLFGKISSFRGKHHTEEDKLKISEKNSRIYELTDPDGNVITVQNLKKFCKERNLNNSLLVLVSKGKRKHHKGWKAKKIKKDVSLDSIL